MCKILTIGEPMALFLADQEGSLEEINHFTKYVSGAELNFSVGMSRLEHRIGYITKVGEDPFGKFIKKFMMDNKINTQYLYFDADNCTGFQLKAKVKNGDSEVVNFRKKSAFSQINMDDISTINWQNVKHLHVTGIPLALSSNCQDVIYKLVTAAKERQVRISFDPNLRIKLWRDQKEMVQVINDLARYSDIILPGIHEGFLLTGSKDANVIADFYLNLGISTVVIKLGEEGAFVKTNSDCYIVPGFKVEKVIDTVGAGDGFAVGVVSGLVEGLSLPEAVKRGTAIGALAVMSPGDNDGLPDRGQLARYMQQKTYSIHADIGR